MSELCGKPQAAIYDADNELVRRLEVRLEDPDVPGIWEYVDPPRMDEGAFVAVLWPGKPVEVYMLLPKDVPS